MSQRNSLSTVPLAASIPRFKRMSSGNPTIITDISEQNPASINVVDQLLTARASVAILDKLWTQIDVLDDVKAMAEDVDRTGGFFNADFSALLGQLKASQARLLEVVSRHQEQGDRAREQRRELAKQHSEVASVDEQGIHQHQERTRQRMTEFFSGEAMPVAEGGQLRDFEELNEYVLDVRHSLGEVSEKITKFDQVTKRLW